MSTPPVGVLALQGAFARHSAVVASLGAPTIDVRQPEDLAQVGASPVTFVNR